MVDEVLLIYFPFLGEQRLILIKDHLVNSVVEIQVIGLDGAYQVFPAVAGSRWRLTGYGLTPATLEGTTAFGVLQVSFFDANGKDLGTVETAGGTTKAKTSSPVNRRSPVGEWISLDTGVATAPEGTAMIHAFTLFVDFSGSDRTQGVYFDDLSLCELNENSETGRCDPQ